MLMRAAISKVARQSTTTLNIRVPQATTARAVDSNSLGGRTRLRNMNITTKTYSVISKGDFGDYSEFSVIFTNRALNLMSSPFQRIMRDLNGLLKDTYNADKVAIMPG